jgi:hypothetical protein
MVKIQILQWAISSEASGVKLSTRNVQRLSGSGLKQFYSC